jgi:hypothetical protein
MSGDRYPGTSYCWIHPGPDCSIPVIPDMTRQGYRSMGQYDVSSPRVDEFAFGSLNLANYSK